jgi:hypothetical protein
MKLWNFERKLCSRLRSRKQCFVSVYRVYSVNIDEYVCYVKETV